MRYCPFFLLLALMGCQVEPPLPPPNILLAIADDASYPHMGAYGTTWVTTPAFDRVAHDGLLFTRAYTPNAKCSPSRAILLTGRHSWQLEEAANHVPHFPVRFKTFMEALGEQGYQVGYTAKGWAPGNPGTVDGIPRQLTGKAYNDLKTTPPAQHISAIDYATNFETFLNEHTGEQPFFFWYGGLEPHRAYEYGAGIRLTGRQPADITSVPPFWPDTDAVRTDMLDYAFEIAYFDQHLQRMLDVLEAQGMLHNTLVIVTADNGMPFPRIKGQAYEYANHLPLAMMWGAGIRHPGRTIDDFVSFTDFAPTFLELSGWTEEDVGMAPMIGRSLTNLMFSDKSGQIDPSRDHTLVGKERHDVGRPNDVGYPIRGIVKGSFLYLHNFEPDRWPAGNPETGYLNCDGSPTKTLCLNTRRTAQPVFWQWAFGKRPQEELYDIEQDPACLNNLATDPAYAAQKAALQEQLFATLTEQGDPRMRGEGALFDQYEYAQERTRGFYERYLAGEPIRAGWVNASDFDNE